MRLIQGAESHEVLKEIDILRVMIKLRLNAIGNYDMQIINLIDIIPMLTGNQDLSEINSALDNRGDIYEGQLVLNDLNINIKDSNTGNSILTGKSKQSFIVLQEDSEKHVLCTSYIDYGCLEIFEEGPDYFKAKIVFTEEEKKEFINHFGEYALVIRLISFYGKIITTEIKRNLD